MRHLWLYVAIPCLVMILLGVNLVSPCVCERPARTPIAEANQSTVRSTQGPTTTGQARRQIGPTVQAIGDLRSEWAQTNAKTSEPPLRDTLT